MEGERIPEKSFHFKGEDGRKQECWSGRAKVTGEFAVNLPVSSLETQQYVLDKVTSGFRINLLVSSLKTQQ
ncbi:MAG: hypothetical protein D3915_15135 [Candidatus Electrothrix sp. AU1_5]|nr:hypothetical protein [Candidatus Electrothrix gigas]